MTDNPLQGPPLSVAPVYTPTQRLLHTRKRLKQALQQPLGDGDGPLAAWTQAALQPLADRHPVLLVLAAAAVGAWLMRRESRISAPGLGGARDL